MATNAPAPAPTAPPAEIRDLAGVFALLDLAKDTALTIDHVPTRARVLAHVAGCYIEAIKVRTLQEENEIKRGAMLLG